MSVIGKGKGCRYAVAEQISPTRLTALTPRQQRALDHVRQAGRITRGEYAALAGVSIRTASRDLAGLVDGGLLVGDGNTGRDAGYCAP